MNDEPCNYCGTPINKNHDCIDALRSQLAEKDAEIKRLTDGINNTMSNMAFYSEQSPYLPMNFTDVLNSLEKIVRPDKATQ